jgi:hypothetical protein
MARKSKLQGYGIIAALVFGGAYYHEKIFDTLHGWGLLKKVN